MAGYGKIFDSIYDGSLADDWRALVTMQQLIVLANAQGEIDMSAGAIARRTGIPREIIDHGLAVLSTPDPDSRTPDDDGRRIVLLDPARPWGWRLVNHRLYRALLSREEKRQADRERIAGKRKAEREAARQAADDATRQDATPCDTLRHVADVAHSRLQITDKSLDPARLDIVESACAVPDPEPEPVQGSMTDPTPPDAPTLPTPRQISYGGLACLAIRRGGIALTNPSHPDLLAAEVEQVPIEAWEPTARECVERGKANFAYVVATARSRHRDGVRATDERRNAGRNADGTGSASSGRRESLVERVRRQIEDADDDVGFGAGTVIDGECARREP